MTVAADPRPETPAAGPADPTAMPEAPAVADAETRACANCDAGMERHQDWCLECGTAAPGRLGGTRPGWRAVATTLSLTLLLVGGAGAASYAALSSDANREAIAQAPTDGAPLAVAPPAVPAPAAPVVPPATTATPKVKVPKATLPAAPEVTPVAPVDTGTLAQVTPPSTPSTPATTPTSTTSTPRSDDTAAGDRGPGTSADGKTTKPPAEIAPIELGAGAVVLYDPYKRAVDPGDPTRAFDGDTGTSFTFGAPDDGKPLQIGVVVDLLKVRQVRAIDLTLKSPGGDVEVFATDSSKLPPDILDTRWEHPASRKGAGKTERILLPKGGKSYRYVTLWFTAPPQAGATVSVSELEILA